MPEDSAESVHVQLTRMEGVINLMRFMLEEVTKASNDNTVRIVAVEIEQQRIRDELASEKEAALTLAAAMREREVSRRAESADRWSPFQRLIVVISGTTSVAAVVIAALALTIR